MNRDTQHTLKAIEGYLASRADKGDELARGLHLMLAPLLAAPTIGEPLPFTVVGSMSHTGHLLVEHVLAADGLNAFAAVAEKHKTATDPAIDFVIALPGHLHESADEFVLPGEGVVISETVLEQADVFGVPPQQAAPVAPPRSR